MKNKKYLLSEKTYPSTTITAYTLKNLATLVIQLKYIAGINKPKFSLKKLDGAILNVWTFFKPNSQRNHTHPYEIVT